MKIELGKMVDSTGAPKAMYAELKDYLAHNGDNTTVETRWGSLNPFDEPEIFVEENLIHAAIEAYVNDHARNYAWWNAYENAFAYIEEEKKNSKPRPVRPKGFF